MLTLADHIGSKLGEKPEGEYACKGCGAKLPAFALVRDDQMRWRCGHCVGDQKRADEPAYEVTWEDVRGVRSVFMASTDWTQLSDVPSKTSSEWAPLRQKARDITKTASTPAEAIAQLKTLKEGPSNGNADPPKK